MLLRQLQARCNKVLVLPGRLYPGRRFLLKGMKRVNGLFETHRVNRAVSVSIVVIYNLKHTGAFAFPWLGPWMLASKLSDTECITDLVFHILGKRQKIAFGGTNPNKQFLSRLKFRSHIIIPKWV